MILSACNTVLLKQPALLASSVFYAAEVDGDTKIAQATVDEHYPGERMANLE